eukprot:362401-Chlamydomonas_euryale.AAC.8
MGPYRVGWHALACMPTKHVCPMRFPSLPTSTSPRSSSWSRPTATAASAAPARARSPPRTPPAPSLTRVRSDCGSTSRETPMGPQPGCEGQVLQPCQQPREGRVSARVSRAGRFPCAPRGGGVVHRRRRTRGRHAAMGVTAQPSPGVGLDARSSCGSNKLVGWGWHALAGTRGGRGRGAEGSFMPLRARARVCSSLSPRFPDLHLRNVRRTASTRPSDTEQRPASVGQGASGCCRQQLDADSSETCSSGAVLIATTRVGDGRPFGHGGALVAARCPTGTRATRAVALA